MLSALALGDTNSQAPAPLVPGAYPRPQEHTMTDVPTPDEPEDDEQAEEEDEVEEEDTDDAPAEDTTPA